MCIRDSTSTMPNIVAVRAPRIRPRIRACDWVCLRPIQTRSTLPIANTVMAAQCDAPYIVNCRSAKYSSVNSPSKILVTGGHPDEVAINPSCVMLTEKPSGAHIAAERTMSDTEMFPADLLDTLAALDPAQRREVTAALRGVVETFSGVPDGRDTAHTLRLLAHFLDSG